MWLSVWERTANIGGYQKEKKNTLSGQGKVDWEENGKAPKPFTSFLYFSMIYLFLRRFSCWHCSLPTLKSWSDDFNRNNGQGKSTLYICTALQESNCELLVGFPALNRKTKNLPNSWQSIHQADVFCLLCKYLICPAICARDGLFSSCWRTLYSWIHKWHSFQPLKQKDQNNRNSGQDKSTVYICTALQESNCELLVVFSCFKGGHCL